MHTHLADTLHIWDLIFYFYFGEYNPHFFNLKILGVVINSIKYFLESLIIRYKRWFFKIVFKDFEKKSFKFKQADATKYVYRFRKLGDQSKASDPKREDPKPK